MDDDWDNIQQQEVEFNFEDDSHTVTSHDFVRYPLQPRRPLWRPLTNPRDIRLLKIHSEPPGNAIIDAKPECTLEIWDLDKAKGKYEALSYAWGQPSNASQQIQCNQITKDVWPNLYRAILTLRSKLNKDKVRRSKLIWVDALCINQDTDHASMEERKSQILLMKDIFGFAAQVLIWLGPHDDASRQIWRSTESIQPDSAMEAVRNILQLSSLKLRQSFINRLWFQRVWTLQEVILSHKATLLCDESELDWTTFCAVWKNRYEFMKNLKPEYRERQSDHIDESLAFVGLMNCFDIQNQLRGPSGERVLTLPLSEIIIRSWYRDATDLHDRIYALLGLVDLTRYPGLEQVDYSKSLNDVFTSITKLAMEIDGTPALLNIAGISPEDIHRRLTDPAETEDIRGATRPTWVPDWTKRGSENSWLTSRLASDDSNARIYADPEHDNRRPWSTSPAFWQPQFQGNKLVISGFFIGRIEKGYHDLGPPFSMEKVLNHRQRGLNWIRPENHPLEYEQTTRLDVPTSGLPYDGKTTEDGDMVCALQGIRSLFLLRPLFDFDWNSWGAEEWLKEDQQLHGLKLDCLLVGPVHVPDYELAENPSLGFNNYWDIIIN